MSAKMVEEVAETADILPFEKPIPKPDGEHPKGKDWLRSLPKDSFFLAHAKSAKGAIFDRWGIAAVIPEAVMLAAPHRNNPLAFEFHWVDSMKFSEQNRFVAILPPPDKEAEEIQDG